MRSRIILACLILFCLALAVRLLSWQDNRYEATKVEWGVTAEYKEAAALLAKGEVSTYLHNLYYMAHPPGYPLVLALLRVTGSESDQAIQIFQIVCDALACVLVFLIVAALLPMRIAVIAGLLVGLSPQLAYYPSLLLPDSLAVFPILIAVYCLVLAYKYQRWYLFLFAGVFVGVSCWLRANALLLPPFFAVATLFLLGRRRWTYALTLLLAAVLTIAPITIKNLVVFHHLVPVSLGAGQKLLQGIAEYDDGRLGVPKTDWRIICQEAAISGRAEDVQGLFSGDGIQRDRARVKRGLGVISSHPVWYAGVMLRRAASFFRLARVPIVSRRTAFSHPLSVAPDTSSVWKMPASELPSTLVLPSQRSTSVDPCKEPQKLNVDASKTNTEFVSPPVTVRRNTDYVYRIPLRLETGRVLANVFTTANGELYSTIIDSPEVTSSSDAVPLVYLPFTTHDASAVRLRLNDLGATPHGQIGEIQLFESGPASYGWTGILRVPINIVQRVFLTAIMLPLTLIGIALLIGRKQWPALVLLLLVPAYYMCVESPLHTERRYVIAMHYFLFALAAVPISFVIERVWKSVGVLKR